jgi:Protein of unknown function (DUF3237)
MRKRLLRPMAVGLAIATLVIGMSGHASSQETTMRSPKGSQETLSKKAMSFVFLTAYKVSITDKIDYGDTPLGKRVDVYFEGDLTGDLLSGTMRGIDYVTTRSDGVTEISPRASLKTSDGALISVQISGYSFPDGTIKDTYVRFLTSDEKYKWLNNKVIFGEGQMTSDTEFEIKYYYEP